ncbi:2-hydroxychromene-2-carboxylate isomerase/DsbA-like thioredoxin domain [Nitrincola lacisaponensis]|uniref:2-hydroxychromene-2-carboxylate isomerase/DsbA-like thioredoxin domain n=1 Tax=Nitrincola lacisaponensis TaxID=267850 RepID=A0A063Y1I8_9GAMM|nr:DsbA family oxidoreductase [Nitrincola lacisaponensis]KDE38995.1 2-hydroxychromene-2-carboxylate isomerase/DsbA-like thioredoxin domain [Nitrincola lacisaponensis]
MQSVSIDIISDIACPWCAIGFARLELAMQQLQEEMTFNVQWHAFELNPDPEGDGEPILQALSRKYGRSADEMERIQSQMQQIAEQLGLNFSALQQRHTRNTFDAHRLVKWAAEWGKQTEMKKALFEAYFGFDAVISDIDVLVGCADSIGLDAHLARQLLVSSQYAQQVRDDEARWHELDITSVPAFIINQQYLISGAQEPEVLVKSLREQVNRIQYADI